MTPLKEHPAEVAGLAGVAAEEVTLSTGQQVQLPIRYEDWAECMAVFPVRAARVAKLLPSPKLRPVQLLPGVALVAVDAMEYRRVTGVHPYNEVSIMVPVLYAPARNIPVMPLLFSERFRHFGWYILHLPVTTREAYLGGTEIWGFPKFLAEITFEEQGSGRRCRLRADGQDILTLEVRKRPTKHQATNNYTYSVKGGELLRTRIQEEGEYATTLFRGGASLTLGDHALAAELRDLGIGKRAVMCLYAPKVQSFLHAAGERLSL